MREVSDGLSCSQHKIDDGIGSPRDSSIQRPFITGYISLWNHPSYGFGEVVGVICPPKLRRVLLRRGAQGRNPQLAFLLLIAVKINDRPDETTRRRIMHNIWWSNDWSRSLLRLGMLSSKRNVIADPADQCIASRPWDLIHAELRHRDDKSSITCPIELAGSKSQPSLQAALPVSAKCGDS